MLSKNIAAALNVPESALVFDESNFGTTSLTVLVYGNPFDIFFDNLTCKILLTLPSD